MARSATSGRRISWRYSKRALLSAYGSHVSDSVTAIEQWHDTYQAVTGAPFPFFFADAD